MDLWQLIAAERRTLAGQLEQLSPEEWDVPSLCGAWTVRDVAAHLVVPHIVTRRQFVGDLLRARGSFARANVAMTAREAVRPTEELLADLRRHADSRFAPPGMGPRAPLTDVLVHGQDIRIPLGIHDSRPAGAWVPVLEFLRSAKARRGFVSGRQPDLRYVADDVAWAAGSGDVVAGPAADLALALSGRAARLDALHGPGVDALRVWVSGR